MSPSEQATQMDASLSIPETRKVEITPLAFKKPEHEGPRYNAVQQLHEGAGLTKTGTSP